MRSLLRDTLALISSFVHSPYLHLRTYRASSAVSSSRVAMPTQQLAKGKRKHDELSAMLAESLPPISLTPQKPVDPTAGYTFWRSIGSPRFIVAPMVNQSELAYRQLCRQYGAQLTYTPMLHSTMFASMPKYRTEHYSSHPTDRPLFVQFCGDNPHILLAAARLLPAGTYDAVDLNLGCPQGIARRGHYGAFLLRESELLQSIVATLHDQLTVPVTCKIRLLETVDDTVALARMLQDAGCAVLCVHGRRKEEIKDKCLAADWDMIRAVKQALHIPVIANGGIASHADVLRCLEHTGCDGVMSSEAILEHPTLFSPSHPPLPTPLTALAATRAYLDVCKQYQPPPSVIKPHLFKLLYRVLCVHTDVRDWMAKCRHGEYEAVVSELEKREAAITDDERQTRYAGTVSWYNRHALFRGPGGRKGDNKAKVELIAPDEMKEPPHEHAADTLAAEETYTVEQSRKRPKTADASGVEVEERKEAPLSSQSDVAEDEHKQQVMSESLVTDAFIHGLEEGEALRNVTSSTGDTTPLPA